MDQLKNTTVRFGITDPIDFAETGQPGDWRRIDVTFAAPFGPPKPGFPKGVQLVAKQGAAESLNCGPKTNEMISATRRLQ
jgi:hypothetical protein